MVSQSMTAPKPALSKRQRRAQGPNPSNSWQQQPRIKSSAARARAYITYAGLNDDKENDDDGKFGKTDDYEGKKNKEEGNKNKNGKNGTTKFGAALLDPTLDLHSPEVKFGRMLGGTDQRSRHRAVKALKEYLRAKADMNSGSGISEMDLLKLWKGLWYTLYMADKVPVQDKLSQVLAELMWCLAGTEEDDEYAGQVYLRFDSEQGSDEDCDGRNVEDEGERDDYDVEIMDVKYMNALKDDDSMDEDDEKSNDGDGDDGGSMEAEEDEDVKYANEKHCRGAHLVSLYISTFLHTVRREWGNVDKHRVDKFYTAVRLMIGEAYKYMAKRHWNLGIIRLFNDVLYEQALSHTPNGLRFHLIDLCIEELAKANQTADIPLTEATFLDCVEPYFALASKAVDKNVQKRVMDKVLLRFLNDYSYVSDVALREDNKEHEDEKSLIFSEVHVGTVAKFIFEVASDTDTDERYRKALYEMHKTYVRQIRAAGRDVALEHFDETEEGGDYEEEEAVGDGEIGKSGDVEAASQELAGDPVDDKNNEEVEKPKKKKKKKDKKRKKEENLDNDEKPADGQTMTTSEKKKDERSKQAEKIVINDKQVDKSPAMHSGKKKKEKKNTEEGGSECVEEPTDEPTTGPFDEQKKKKKKISKTKRSESEEVKIKGQVAAQASKSCGYKGHNEEAEPPKPKTSKKKRKKDDSTADTSITDSTASVVSTPTPKKNKKQKHTTPPSAMIESDGIVNVFSEADVNQRESSSEEAETSDSAARRVKFGKMNHCKSYKASMKALKTLDQQVWSTANRTPDKSILLKSKLSDVKNSSKKKQKRNEKKRNE